MNFSTSPFSRRRRACALALWLGVYATCVPATTALAQPVPAERPRGALVKAAFLHKFFSFVEWPQGTFVRPDAPVRIGVIGDEEILHDLQELAKDRPRDGRPVAPVPLAPGEAMTGIHILYIKSSNSARIAEVLSQVPEGVLTVADIESGHPKGSVMSFYVEDGRIRFGISLEAAARQRLRLDTRLLSVAKRIQGSADFDEEVQLGWLDPRNADYSH